MTSIQHVATIMDIKIERKTGLLSSPYKIALLIVGALLSIGLLWSLLRPSRHTRTIEGEAMAVSIVEQGEFRDYIRLVGQVQPATSIHISAVEGGIVEERLVDEGAMVEAGQVIVRLSNPSLSLSILDSEAQLAEKQNFLRNTRIAMEQDRLSLARELLQVDLDVARKKRHAEQYRTLYAEALCSQEDYLQAQEDYNLAQGNAQLIRQRQSQDSIYRGVQVQQMEESLANMYRNLAMVRQRADNLAVKAPISGQIGSMQVEVGQMISAGSLLGQIHLQDEYKITADIDEIYIDRIFSGQAASCERAGVRFPLTIDKVYPEVRDKTFRADLKFSTTSPEQLRSGQSYHVHIELGSSTSLAVLLPRGAFYSDTGGRWVYVLSPDRRRAEKRHIVIGRQNPRYYEVVSGLKPGEEVISSSYQSYGEADILNIN